MRLGAITRTGCALAIVLSCLCGFTVTASATSPAPIATGYWGADSAGNVRNDGAATDLGDLHGVHLNAPIVGIAASPGGAGYWLAAADGGVFAFGDARFYGSAADLHLNAPIVGIAAWPGSGGYWLAAADGGVFSFGGAPFYGSAGNLRLNAPVVGIAATARGYWLAAADGGVFTYGDAPFYGSAGNLQLNAPIVGIAHTALRRGYLLAANDGGVFAYGDARFYGRSGDAPASAIATTEFGGYVVQHSIDGRLSSFGSAGSCSPAVLPLPSQPAAEPRFVGVVAAFDPTWSAFGALATVRCPIRGGETGAFRAPSRWHIDVGVDPTRGTPCAVQLDAFDPGGTVPHLRPSRFAHSGSIQIRSTQMAGHSLFSVAVVGVKCSLVVSNAYVDIQTLPFSTTAFGDTRPFSSSSPITITANGNCVTEVRADSDGRLVQRRTGSSYTMNVPAGSYWLSNSEGCTVSVS